MNELLAKAFQDWLNASANSPESEAAHAYLEGQQQAVYAFEELFGLAVEHANRWIRAEVEKL